MPPKARRGRPKKKVDEEPEEARTSESDLDQQDRTSENENESSEHDMPMEQEQNEIQIPDDENSSANLKRQYDEEQDTVQPETKKTKVEDMDADRAEEDDIAEEDMSEEQKLIMMEKRMKREQEEKEEAVEKAKLEEEARKKAEHEAMYTPDGKRRKSPELLKFWKAVEDDPNDFTGWTYLLQHVDASGILEQGREAYDQFLFRYPYCYGYWKKFADFEKKKGDSLEKCMMVFERGIKAIALSADLWIHYLNHVREEYKDQPEFIRAQYERSVAACGREWRSDKLWDHYVKWETKIEDTKGESAEEGPGTGGDKHYGRILRLYERVLRNETQGLSHQFDMFRDFVKDHTPKQLLEINEFLAMRKEVLESLAKEKEKRRKRASENDNSDKEEDEAPGEDETEHFAISADEENQAMRENIIKEQKKIFKETEEKVQARWKYEDSIKRPYFHMKPLERGQLKNWSDYLAHEIEKSNTEKKDGKEGNDTGIEILFERCLIACALYEEFWIKYADWIKDTLGVEQNAEKMRDVFKRACEHHLPKKVEVHLAWAAFEEQQQNFEACSEILKNLEKQHPQLMSIQLRRINLERRRDNIEEVHRLYKHCIKEAKSVSVSSELSIKYARFLRLWPAPVNYNIEGAIKIIEEALIKDEKNARLYLQLLDIYMHSKPLDYSKIISVFEKALSVKEVKQEKEKDEKEKDGKEKDEKADAENDEAEIDKEKDVKEEPKEKEYEVKMVSLLSAKHRLLFSQRRLDFLEDFSFNINDVLKAQDEHSKLKVELKPSDNASSGGSGVKTNDGRGGSKKHGQTNGTATYGATANSASYGAAHTNQYQQYGSRYNQHYSGSAGAGAGYGGSQYNNYYGQSGGSYGGQSASTGGGYGSTGNYGSSY